MISSLAPELLCLRPPPKAPYQSTRRQLTFLPASHIPHWSQTPAVTCTLALTSTSLLPSTKFKASAFIPYPGLILTVRNYTFFGAQCRACNLAPSSFGPPLPVLPVDFANVLLAKLCSCGTSADRPLRAGASSAKRLTVQSILLSARASPARRCTAFAMYGHPLGNNIKFHPPLGWNPSDSDLAGHENLFVRFPQTLYLLELYINPIKSKDFNLLIFRRFI